MSSEIPCSFADVPCSDIWGIWLESFEIIGLTGLLKMGIASELQNSLFFSLLAGN
jgi:hypothetical protein